MIANGLHGSAGCGGKWSDSGYVLASRLAVRLDRGYEKRCEGCSQVRQDNVRSRHGVGKGSSITGNILSVSCLLHKQVEMLSRQRG